MTRLARLTSNWVAIRELKQHHTAPDGSPSAVIQLDDPNKTPNTVITGIVEQVGPGKRYKGGLVVPVALRVGQTVYFEIEMGRARLPWDLDVRVMRETDVAGVLVDGHVTPYMDHELCLRSPNDPGYHPDHFNNPALSMSPVKRISLEELIEMYPVGEVLPDEIYVEPITPVRPRTREQEILIKAHGLKMADASIGRSPATPHPDDLSTAEAKRIRAAAANRLLPVRER